MKLHESLAVIKGRKTEATRAATEAYHLAQRADLFSGHTRKYAPLADDGEQLPPESKRVQVTVDQLLQGIRVGMTPFFDVTAQRDWANCEAKGDVVVDGKTVLAAVPVTYLLFLEKELVGIGTALKAMPTLDPGEQWALDENTALWVSDKVRTTRSAKVPQNHELAPATKEHPAQVQVYNKDVPVGTWEVTKMAGGIPPTRLAGILKRHTDLLEAVKFAREKANAAEVPASAAVGDKVFGYLLG